VPRYTYDYDYQVGILKLCVRDPTFLKTHPDVVQPNFFSVDNLMIVAQMILGFFEKSKGDIPSPESLRKAASDYFLQFNVVIEVQHSVMDLVNRLYTEELRNATSIRDSVCRFAQRQALRIGLRDVLRLLDKDEDLESAVEIVRRSALVGTRRREGWNFFREVHEIKDKLAQDANYNEVNKIPTGFSKIDEVTFGGIGVGQIWVVGAKPKGGKSTLMVNIGCSGIYTGKKIYHYSFGDMNKMDVLVKYAQCIANMTVQELFRSQFTVSHKVNQAVLSCPGAYLEIIYESPGVMSVEDVYSDLGYRRAQSGISPDLVIIDYANKMKQPLKESSYRSMSMIYGGLKELGDSFDCGVLTGAQLRRDAKSGEGHAEDIAESWLQIADCDSFIVINQTEAENKASTARLSMPIVRRGRTVDRLDVAFIKERARITTSGTATSA
jgi:hypothetical protein